MRQTYALLAVAAALLTGTAAAQQPATFRLTKSPSNTGVCNGLDAAMSREHTVTPAGDKAVLKFPGGNDEDMKQVTPGTYRTELELGRVKVEFVADLSKTPKTLVVREPREGCRWTGEAP
ncbi:hypothetical protein FHP25_03110 [Vineibacter terrae]|uniref:Uncharacterized protein n=1 Tax=Vineibacter terrae TaxID=2586908 RepID=A0A5C8PT49_9HYPH|nr:hypothetical protein [Vineibacter terrae]TXL81532.1 hypothetical protein FHP25_03110 [Vineibacter terrae]